MSYLNSVTIIGFVGATWGAGSRKSEETRPDSPEAPTVVVQCHAARGHR